MKNTSHMKKLFLILVMTAMVTTAWSQSKISTIRGKTKEGKTIKVEYYQGSVEDVIESVKYQLVDELQSQVKDLQSKTKTLQGKVDDYEKQVKSLKAQLAAAEGNKPQPNNDEAKRLRKELNDKEAEISGLNNQIADLRTNINGLQANIDDLKKQRDAKQTSVDSLKRVVKSQQQIIVQGDKNDAVNRLRDSIVSKDKRIQDLSTSIASYKKQVNKLEADLRKKQEATPAPTQPTQGLGKPAKAPAIGFALDLGPAINRNDMADIWAKDVTTGWALNAYFETARLSDGFPLSIQIGLGIGKYNLSGRVNSFDTSLHGYVDVDGDTCTANYSFTGIKETLSLTYLNIPVNFCFGQPSPDRVTGYFRLGFTPSVKIGSSFTGEGKYALNADYYQWGLHLDDVAHLGYGEGFDCYDNDVQPDVNSFVLWFSPAFGLYLPLGSSVLLNAGVKCDMMLMSAGKAEATENGMSFSPNTCNLLIGGPKVFCPSVELGLVYSLK